MLCRLASVFDSFSLQAHLNSICTTESLYHDVHLRTIASLLLAMRNIDRIDKLVKLIQDSQRLNSHLYTLTKGVNPSLS